MKEYNYTGMKEYNYTGMKEYIIAILLIGGFIFLQMFDLELLTEINLNRNRDLDHLFLMITNLTGPVTYGVPVLLLGMSMVKRYRLNRGKAVYIGATVLFAAIVTNILKYSIDRTRPFIVFPFLEKLAAAGSPSFPSGHTSDAFALATSLSIVYPRWPVIIFSYTWAIMVGYSRMSLGVHYPTDVLAGAVVGIGSAYLCSWFQKKLEEKRKRRSEHITNESRSHK
ncbi:MAG: phosphatase PAP2 family protein [Mangrovibacterium sp.]